MPEDPHREVPGPTSGPARRCPAPAPRPAPAAERSAADAITPTATHAASSAAPAARHRQPRTGRAASSSVARVSPCTPTHAAGWMNTSPTGPGNLPDAAPWVPGKAGQHELPREVRQHPGAGQRQDARPAGRCQARHAAGGGDEHREPRGDRRHGERHQPPEARRLEQDRLGDPVEAEHMMAEAEPPAAPRGHRGGPRRVEQDQQTGHRDQQHRNDVERRQCRRRKRAQPERGQIGAQTAQGGETRLQACRACQPATRPPGHGQGHAARQKKLA